MFSISFSAFFNSLFFCLISSSNTLNALFDYFWSVRHVQFSLRFLSKSGPIVSLMKEFSLFGAFFGIFSEQSKLTLFPSESNLSDSPTSYGSFLARNWANYPEYPYLFEKISFSDQEPGITLLSWSFSFLLNSIFTRLSVIFEIVGLIS